MFAFIGRVDNCWRYAKHLIRIEYLLLPTPLLLLRQCNLNPHTIRYLLPLPLIPPIKATALIPQSPIPTTVQSGALRGPSAVLKKGIKQRVSACLHIIKIQAILIGVDYIMLRAASKFAFSKEYRIANTVNGIDSNLQDILAQRQKIRREVLRKEMDNLPAQQSIRSFYDSLVNITLYMRNDSWKSQYLYLMLNYNKLGFRRISDLVTLDRASYLLDLRTRQDQERWPAIKVVVALEPKVIVSGVDSITEFFKENGYFVQEVDRNSGEVEALVAHIDREVVPHMESLFWHPKLTFQYTFHTNLSSYADTSRQYRIFGILGRNYALIAKRVAANLISIAREPQRYHSSKDNFTRSIRQLQHQYLKKAPFFGGIQPNHVDFYLMSQLRTRSGCHLFTQYLQQKIGGDFWSWWMRVSHLCHYNPDRITTL